MTDEELWQRICLGDQSAWKELILRYKALVYTVCSYSGLSQADAADCFQQTWVLLYNHRNGLEQPARISSWLVTTARREAMRIRRLADRTISDDSIYDRPDSAALPDSELELLEVQAQLELALQSIDAPCRKLLELFFFADKDLSYEEIARHMGLAANTLGAKRRRCLEKLRQLILDNDLK
jgi:RNA polymerase sigma factor (sigma-70 family)